jgi:hypothetical protein
MRVSQNTLEPWRRLSIVLFGLVIIAPGGVVLVWMFYPYAGWAEYLAAYTVGFFGLLGLFYARDRLST